MKILHVSTYDIIGGAARSAYRLHQGLLEIQAESLMLVQSKSSSHENVIAPQKSSHKLLAKVGHALDAVPAKLYRQRPQSEFSTQWFIDSIHSQVSRINPDIINLHWINESFLKIETIKKINCPIVWTLHDMWAFTGGCHYDQDCGRYIVNCGNCPQLNSHTSLDLSRLTWYRKRQAWKNLNLTIVTPSQWLSKCAANSSLFRNRRIEVIPYGLDIQQYKPINRQVIRQLLNLPTNKQLVLFVAVNATSSPRKGFNFLKSALQQLCNSGWNQKIELVVIGASQNNGDEILGFKTHFLGKLRDDISLSQIYAAVDVFVAPSIQDNLPNTVLEAIACGTPAVAFNVGGVPDMIEHQQNGYLVQPFDIEDLAQGIAWVLENPQRHQKLCDRAREKAEREFSLEIQARRYMSLYSQLT